MDFNTVCSLLLLLRLLLGVLNVRVLRVLGDPRLLLGLAVAGLLVDVNFLVVLLGLLRATKTLFLVDANFLLDVSVAVSGSWWCLRVDGG